MLKQIRTEYPNQKHHLDGVIVSFPLLNEDFLEFDPWLIQIKDIKVGICCIYAKHTAFRIKCKVSPEPE